MTRIERARCRGSTTTSRLGRGVPCGGSTVNNMTRDEAQHRARLLRVDGYDVALDLTVGRRRSGRRRRELQLPRAGGHDLPRPDRRERARGRRSTGVSLAPDEVFDGTRITPAGSGDGEHAARRRRLRLHAHRRGAAPLRRPGRQADLPVHPVRDVRRPPDVRLLRPARPQGDASPSPSPRRRTGRSSPNMAALDVAEPTLPGCVPTTSPSPADVDLHHRARRRARTTACSTPTPPPDGTTIPLGVYCRASLAEHLDADVIFEVTKQGFDFFHELFDLPYPFGKYDQLFVPSSTPARWRTPAA